MCSIAKNNRFLIVFVLVAIVAALIASISGQPYSSVAQQPLTPTLTFSSDLKDLITGRGVAISAAWDTDSERIAIGGSAGIWIYTDMLDEIAHLEGPEHGITAIDWSVDGNRLAAGGLDGSIWIWDMTTYQLVVIHEVFLQRGIVSLAWSPGGDMIASSSFTGPVRMLDAITGQVLLELDDPATKIYGYASSTGSLSWHPEQNWLIGATCPGGVYAWNAETGEVIRQFSLPSTCIRAVAWSPDGRLIMSGGDTTRGRTDRLPEVWDFETSDLLVSLNGYSDVIYSVSWSADNRRVATWSADGLIRIENVVTGQTLATLKASIFNGDLSSYYETTIAWSPDRRKLIGVGVDGFVRIWDMDTYELLIEWQGFNGFVDGDN